MLSSIPSNKSDSSVSDGSAGSGPCLALAPSTSRRASRALVPVRTSAWICLIEPLPLPVLQSWLQHTVSVLSDLPARQHGSCPTPLLLPLARSLCDGTRQGSWENPPGGWGPAQDRRDVATDPIYCPQIGAWLPGLCSKSFYCGQ